MGYKRRALIQVSGAIIDSIAQAQRDNISGQLDLFGDFTDNGQKAPAVIKIPDIEEYSSLEKMALEKETTGLYLSGHPMDGYRDAATQDRARSRSARCWATSPPTTVSTALPTISL